MARFIPVDKMKKLREAAKTGDERAKKILSKQWGGTEDFSADLDEYFMPPAPVQETSTEQAAEAPETSKLSQFLKENGIEKGHPEYDNYVQDFYNEFPNEKKEETQECECECVEEINKLRKEESDAIDSYSKSITLFMNSQELNDNQKRKIISRLKEIRSDEEEHFRELNELLTICNSKEEEETNLENDEGIVE